jgi:hypothetical protein
MYQLIDKLSADEVRKLQQYIERRLWVQQFDEAVLALREGLTQEQIEEIVEAINIR